MNLLFPPLPHALSRARDFDSPCDADALIVSRVRSGERAAFNLLLERHRERVLNLAFSLLGSRADAEDAAQEAFVRAYESLPRFRGESAFGTWLYRITVNVCLARLRQMRPRACQEEDGESQVLEACDKSDLARAFEARTQVQQALSSLSPVLRAVLVLREMQGLSYQEIAMILSIPIGTVRSRLNEARRLFRAAWEQMEQAHD